MEKKLTQLQFIVLESIVKKYKRTSKGMEQKKWLKNVKKCTREALEKGDYVEQESCCDCMEPTDKGLDYVSTIAIKLKTKKK
jgi:hypothetical protein